MSRKVKRLSDHDVQEVVKFQEYLHDINSGMSYADFAAKYQEYMGLSDAEVAAWIKKQEPVSPTETSKP